MQEAKPPKKRLWLHLLLFVITFITTTLAGAEWMHGRLFFFRSDMTFGFSDWLDYEVFVEGLQFSVPFLLILTIHEFGHYFMARRYNISVSLPFYIPLWTGFMSTIGTMGAFIKLQSPTRTRNQFFDIGIAGPLAGFVASLLVLWYGFTHLPDPAHIFSIHPEYKQYGLDYVNHAYEELKGSGALFSLGDNLLFWLFKNYVATDPSLVPNPYEIIHYPVLFAGYLALFFTALNLIPVGQLDGGHVLYGLVGKKNHAIISPLIFVAFIMYAGLGVFRDGLLFFLPPVESMDDLMIFLPFYGFALFSVFMRLTPKISNNILAAVFVLAFHYLMFLLYPNITGYNGWLVFGFILGRFLGIYHPGAQNEAPLDFKRKVLGWLALAVFILCFTPRPFIFE